MKQFLIYFGMIGMVITMFVYVFGFIAWLPAIIIVLDMGIMWQIGVWLEDQT